MQTLEKRITALESSVVDTEMVMHILFVGLNHSDEELTRWYDNYGNEWRQLPGESNEAWKDRATAETQRNGNAVALLFGEYGTSAT